MQHEAMLNPDQYVGIADACRLFKVSYNVVHKPIVSGQIPAFRTATGGRWLLKKADLPKIAKTLGVEYYPAKSGAVN